MRRSVGNKLIAAMLASTLAGLLVAVGTLLAYELRQGHRIWVNDLATQAELLGHASAGALVFDDARVATENLQALRNRPRIRAAAIYDERGRLFAHYGEFVPAGAPPEEAVEIDGEDIILFRHVRVGAERLGGVYLRAHYELYERLLRYLGIAGLALLAAMFVAYAVSLWMRRVLTGPLLAITALAREVAQKRNFSLRAEVLTRDEIGMLAATFNAMLAEIERTTGELGASNREIQRLNVELEKRVKERTAQLELANAELEAFCYSVSHDLRAPLRAIDGFSQALMDDFPGEVPKDAQGYLSRIRASTQRMGQLIEDLLDLSRVSRVELQRREVDLGRLARQVGLELQQREPGRQLELHIENGLRADADPRLLRVALENLLGNAWKFTARAPASRIEVGRLARDAAAPGASGRSGPEVFFVRDNGAGFNMAYADRLFAPFQRLHSAHDFPGSGIGLATVQRIVHRHGGRIWADARPEAGATFYFTLSAEEV